MEKRKFFDDIAENWEKEHHGDENNGRLEELVCSFELTQGDLVLDAGCGTGRLVPFLLKAVGDQGFIFETDFSGHMLRIGQKKFRKKNIFFAQVDAENLPLQGNLFDVVVCFSLFPHLVRKLRALLEFRRVLKPGGRLIIAHLMGSRELNAYHARIKGPVSSDRLPEHREMEKLFRAARFSEFTIRDEPGLYLARIKT